MELIFEPRMALAAFPTSSTRLVQLTYVSSAREAFSAETILDILRVSRRKNARDGITGTLVYKSGSVLQILEGREDLVRALFEVIKADPRHHRVNLLFVWPIDERSFPQWTMAFRQFEVGDVSYLDGYSELLTPGFDLAQFGVNRSERLLKAFIECVR